MRHSIQGRVLLAALCFVATIPRVGFAQCTETIPSQPPPPNGTDSIGLIPLRLQQH